MSSQYENDIAKEIHRSTEETVRSYRCGYSGNNAMPQPDVLVTTPTENIGLELKGPLEQDHIYIDGEDLEQLVECANATTIVMLVVKFQRREPVVVRHYANVPRYDGWASMSAEEQFARLTPEEFDPTVTDGGNLKLNKPDTDTWRSATASEGDVPYLLDCLSIDMVKANEN